MNQTKVVIIGSGPAAYTAAIYLARAELHPVLFEGDYSTGLTVGGQLTTTTDVENFPGFPDGINGFELVENMKQQAIKYGTTVISETVITVKLEGVYNLETNKGDKWTFKSLVIATGAKANRLENLIGLDKYWNKGISACAVCDGALPLFRNKPLVVIGGGDSAMEEAMFLSKYSDKVYIVHRREELRASKIMQSKVKHNNKIQLILGYEAEKVEGGEFLECIILKKTIQDYHHPERNFIKIDCNGLFFAIGHTPLSNLFTDYLIVNKTGYIQTFPDSTQVYNKNMEPLDGVFACGDVQDFKWRQAITAAGTGCMSALEVEKYLENLEHQYND